MVSEPGDNSQTDQEFQRLSYPDINCPNCGYCLTGATEPVCPECGQAFSPNYLYGREYHYHWRWLKWTRWTIALLVLGVATAAGLLLGLIQLTPQGHREWVSWTCIVVLERS